MMEVRGVLNRLGFVLCIGTAAICTVLHVATFLTILPPVWVLPPFLLMAGAVICANAVQSRPRRLRFTLPTSKLALLGCGLLVYAVLTFAYFYKTTGGASGVGIVDGHYVSQYKGRVIRTITEYEYRMLPNLWTRVMSAWIGMMSVFCASDFVSTANGRFGSNV
jgi:hypothetical protein